jgi:hypothetical protein
MPFPQVIPHSDAAGVIESVGTVRRRGDLDLVHPAVVTQAVALDESDPAEAIRALAPDGVDRIVEIDFSGNADLDAADLTTAARDGALHVMTDTLLPLEQTARAHDRVDAGPAGEYRSLSPGDPANRPATEALRVAGGHRRKVGLQSVASGTFVGITRGELRPSSRWPRMWDTSGPVEGLKYPTSSAGRVRAQARRRSRSVDRRPLPPRFGRQAGGGHSPPSERADVPAPARYGLRHV